MAETLGSLCDKLTIVKLKQYHSDDQERLKSLSIQEKQLQEEINVYVAEALNGIIPVDKLTFQGNKIYKQEGNETRHITGSIGEVFAELAEVNCKLWHEQEKVYEFDKVLPEEKNRVIKNLAILNLERNKCINSIDKSFQDKVLESLSKK